jgi:hypothetical protein
MGITNMTRAIGIATATAMTLLGAVTAYAAAQQPDTRDKTIMTFSSAVELPRMTLEAGTYVFRLADTPSRDVIQVLSQDEMTTLGQWLFVSAQRPEVSGDTVVTFRETSAGSTPAVQFWYYPGERIGKEFIYPKDQALRIAQRTGATVRSDEGPVTASAQAAIQPATEPISAPPAVVVAPDVAPTRLPERQPTAVVAAETTQQAPPADARDRVRLESTTAENELPATAGLGSLSALIGVLSLAGAAGIRWGRPSVR